MKTLHLLTQNNQIYMNALSRLTDRIKLHPHVLSDLKAPLSFKHGDIAVYQTGSNAAIADLRGTVRKNPSCTHIFITVPVTPEHRKFFLENGISDVLKSPHPDDLYEYLSLIFENRQNQKGSVLIYDDDEPKKKIIKNLISRFSYRPVFVSSTDEFFSSMTETRQLYLINLGISGLDLNSFVRHCHASSEIRRCPLISYKESQQGLFVNEVISGLNRYSTYILTPEEVYSFLIEVLFRKEMMEGISALNEQSGFKKYASYSHESVSQIYHSCRDNLFPDESLAEDETISSLQASLSAVHRTTIRVSGLNWLRHKKPESSVNTCGVCG